MSLNKFAGMSCNLLSGLLFLIGMILLIKNKDIIQTENVIVIIFLSSISIGVHGLGHYFGNDFVTIVEKREDNLV